MTIFIRSLSNMFLISVIAIGSYKLGVERTLKQEIINEIPNVVKLNEYNRLVGNYNSLIAEMQYYCNSQTKFTIENDEYYCFPKDDVVILEPEKSTKKQSEWTL